MGREIDINIKRKSIDPKRGIDPHPEIPDQLKPLAYTTEITGKMTENGHVFFNEIEKKLASDGKI